MAFFKILIIPSLNNEYDRRMVASLSKGFQNLGYEAYSASETIDGENLRNRCIDFKFNVIIHVNGVRDRNYPLPKSVKYISWYQDVFIDTQKKIIHGLDAEDILYTISDAKILGIHSLPDCRHEILLSGVDSNIGNFKNTGHLKNDISIVGFIPENLEKDTFYYIEKLKKINGYEIYPKLKKYSRKLISNILFGTKSIELIMKEIVEKNYEPLTGSLDIKKLESIIRNEVSISAQTQNNSFEDRLNFYVQTYPRKIDREVLAKAAIRASKKISLYGPNWSSYSDFKKFDKGFIDSQEKLLSVYQNSNINLSSNTHGLGIHSRVLESMAVGGYIMTHRSINDFNQSGIATHFNENIHYNYYNVSDLSNNLKWWLNPSKSNKINEIRNSARHEVLKNHTWERRSEKIIEDLKKC